MKLRSIVDDEIWINKLFQDYPNKKHSSVRSLLDLVNYKHGELLTHYLTSFYEHAKNEWCVLYYKRGMYDKYNGFYERLARHHYRYWPLYEIEHGENPWKQESNPDYYVGKE